MSTSPNTWLAFPFLRIENGVVRFWISEDETLDISIADLGLASSASIILFEENSDITIGVSEFDYDNYSVGTPDSSDYILYSDVSDSNITKKAPLSSILSGGSSAPVDATYVTLTSNATLTNESILAAGSGLSLTGSTFSVDFASVQAKDATLTSIANLGTSANKILYTTGIDTWAESDISAAGRALIDDADAATQRNTLGLGTIATQSAASVNITGGVVGTLSNVASASQIRTDLGLGSLATQSGTFSGTSSGTNTGDQNIFASVVVSGQTTVTPASTSTALTLVAGTNVTITTDNTAKTVTINSSGGGGGLTDGDKGDITVSSSGTVWTIDNTAVSYAKIQNVTTDRLLGRDTASSGTVEEITVGGGLEFTGSTGIQRSALTGDITASAGSNSTTLATVNSNVGSFGSGSNVATFTVNGKGLITAASNTAISITSAAVSDFNEAAQDAVGGILGSEFTYNDAANTITISSISNTKISGLGTLATQSGTFSGTSSGTNTGDQNLFSTIAVSGQSNVVADSTSDTLTLEAGSNVTITTNPTTDTITISASVTGSGSFDYGLSYTVGQGYFLN